MTEFPAHHEAEIGVIEFLNVEEISLMNDGTLGLVGQAIMRREDESRRIILKCAVQSIIPLPSTSHGKRRK